MRSFPSIPTRALILKEWKYIKGKIIPLSIGLALFGFLTVGMLKVLPNLAEYLEGFMPEVTPEMSIQSFVNSATSVISIIAVILCADAVAGEREHNTLVLIQTKPINPISVILTKLITRYLLVLVGTIVAAIVLYFSTWGLIGLPDIVSFILSMLVYAITLFTFTSIGMFISTIAKSQISAGAIAAGIVFLITIVSSLLMFDEFQPYNIFMLAVNLTTMEFQASTIVLGCLVLLLIGLAFSALSILRYYSEKELTRKKV